MQLLVADIGGTNARVALCTVHRGSPKGMPRVVLGQMQVFSCKNFKRFSHLLEAVATTFALGGQQQARSLHGVCIAAAGPVVRGTCRMSNLPWVITPGAVQKTLGGQGAQPPVFVINDFTAQAHAAFILQQLEAARLFSGVPQRHAPLAVAGAGTGFGKALAVPLHRLVLPSEGGHTSFPFEEEEEFAFAHYLRKRTGRVPVGDTVLSGSGFAALHTFFTGQEATPQEACAALPGNPMVLEWFARFYGRYCRNYVLDTLALQGLVVTGGVAAKVPFLQHPTFLGTFYTNDKQEALLRRVPVWHLHDGRSGLAGAAVYAALKL
ncbi:glucokinase [Desulfovibrio cuneatus]|uniref:glucokinase n=1 Tax=Desulfovibrio cuneatus TaxID=159728 RepID=UPI0003FA7BC4|nr:glucokinase [Desulfovibrio cuneatus]